MSDLHEKLDSLQTAARAASKDKWGMQKAHYTPHGMDAFHGAISPHDMLKLIDQIRDKIDGLEADLSSAVEVAFKRGAEEWVRLNYPTQYRSLANTGKEDRG